MVVRFFGLVGLLAGGCCFGATGDDFVDVMFIGNSYTYANGMVDTLEKLVVAARKDGVDILPLRTEMIAPGGFTLERHWKNPKDSLVKRIGTKSIKGGTKPFKWDFVVMQEQSQGALKPATRSSMAKYAALISKAAKDNGSECIYYMTWGRRVTFNTDGSGKTASRNFMYEVMQNGKSVVVDPKVMSTNGGIAKTYRKIADDLGAKVSPCGIAFEEAIKAGIVVHNEKEKYGSHPSRHGSYLVACVFYGTIYGRNPEEIPDNAIKNIPAKIAAKLQAIANRVVKEELLPKEVLKASENFKTRTDRMSYVDALTPYLKPGLDKEEVLSLLGKPNEIEEHKHYSALRYVLTFGMAMSVITDENGKLLQVNLPGKFLSHYDRVWVFIRVGMTKKEVVSWFYGPSKMSDDGKEWQYSDPDDPHSYTVIFDDKDIVIKLEKTRESP